MILKLHTTKLGLNLKIKSSKYRPCLGDQCNRSIAALLPPIGLGHIASFQKDSKEHFWKHSCTWKEPGLPSQYLLWIEKGK